MENEYLPIIVTQQAQMIDILMLILQHHNPNQAGLVDHIHNDLNKIMAELTPEELAEIKERR